MPISKKNCHQKSSKWSELTNNNDNNNNNNNNNNNYNNNSNKLLIVVFVLLFAVTQSQARSSRNLSGIAAVNN